MVMKTKGQVGADLLGTNPSCHYSLWAPALCCVMFQMNGSRSFGHTLLGGYTHLLKVRRLQKTPMCLPTLLVGENTLMSITLVSIDR